MFSESEFKNLTFPAVYKAKKGTLPTSLPELAAIKSWWNCDNPLKDPIIRYISFAYDISSPFVKRFNSLDMRKREAALFAGFNLEDPNFIPFKDLKDETFVDMVMEFLIYQNNHIWVMLVSCEQTFYEFQKTLLQESSMIRNDKDKIAAIASKSKLIEESGNIVDKIISYRKQLFGEKEIIEAASKIASSPEAIAKLM
jgi:hypothetical protein